VGSSLRLHARIAFVDQSLADSQHFTPDRCPLQAARQTIPVHHIGLDGIEQAEHRLAVGHFDRERGFVVGLDTAFDSMRFYVPQAALDEIANEEGTRRINRLDARQFGGRDPVMYGFAQTLAGAMAHPGHNSAMFCDHMALAFFAHIVPLYANLPIKEYPRGGLAPWQLRRAYEFIDDNLDADPSISEVARQCGLSSSYFNRAFKCASGFSTHRWLTKRRVERAKSFYANKTCNVCIRRRPPDCRMRANTASSIMALREGQAAC
jgi:hypothetical protein